MKNINSIGLLNQDCYFIPAHQHSLWEIIYYTHGNGILTIGDTSIPFQAGKIICQPPMMPHSEVSKTGFRNIHFSIANYDNPKSSIPIFNDNDNLQVFNLLMQLYNEFHIKRHNWKLLTESLLSAIFQYMVAFSAQTDKNPWVEKMEELIIRNLSNPALNIKELMKSIPLSIDHARRLFVKENGKTPVEYLNEKRIAYAKDLLKTCKTEDAMYIKEIAYLAGFTDQYYFSRVFKKQTGKCPREWMNMLFRTPPFKQDFQPVQVDVP